MSTISKALSRFFILFMMTATMAAAAPKEISYISVDVNTGRILSQKDAHKRMYPASLTKMMTLYVLFDAIQDGHITLDTRFKVSANAASKPASKLYLKAGSTIRVEDAIQALAIKSANDVATVVAENMAGTEESFARTMTLAARQLGMRRTTFKNASGLHNSGQVSTAYDMYLLGLALQDRFPRFYRYFGKSSFTYAGRKLYEHNPFVGAWRGVDGIKTGYTNASGFNLVTNIKRDDRHVIAVVMGASSSNYRSRVMSDILTRSLSRAYAGNRTHSRLDYNVAALPQRAENSEVVVAFAPREPRGGDITLSRKPDLFNELPETFYFKDQRVLAMMVKEFEKAEVTEVRPARVEVSEESYEFKAPPAVFHGRIASFDPTME